MVHAFRRFVQFALPVAFLSVLVIATLAMAAVGLFPTAAIAASAGEVSGAGDVSVPGDASSSGSASGSGGEYDWSGEFARQRSAIEESGSGTQLCGSSGALSGSLADILTSQQLADLVCEAQRSFYSLSTGVDMRASSAESGGDCRVLSLDGEVLTSSGSNVSDQSAGFETKSMNVCFSDASPWAQRGGTTYGNTFLTSATFEQFMVRGDKASLLRHEYRHYYQWRLLGKYFPSAYLIAGANACTNVLEQAAGLEDGGYTC